MIIGERYWNGFQWKVYDGSVPEQKIHESLELIQTGPVPLITPEIEESFRGIDLGVATESLSGKYQPPTDYAEVVADAMAEVLRHDFIGSGRICVRCGENKKSHP